MYVKYIKRTDFEQNFSQLLLVRIVLSRWTFHKKMFFLLRHKKMLYIQNWWTIPLFVHMMNYSTKKNVLSFDRNYIYKMWSENSLVNRSKITFHSAKMNFWWNLLNDETVWLNMCTFSKWVHRKTNPRETLLWIYPSETNPHDERPNRNG